MGGCGRPPGPPALGAPMLRRGAPRQRDSFTGSESMGGLDGPPPDAHAPRALPRQPGEGVPRAGFFHARRDGRGGPRRRGSARLARKGAAMFKADLRAIRFTLYEHLKVQQLFELDAFSHLAREECDAVIDQCVRFAAEVTGPLSAPGDRAGCRVEDGRVVTPPGFREAWRTLFELGFLSFTMPVKAGGFGGPRAIGVVLSELQSGANTAFNMYPGLTHGAADLLEAFGSPRDHERFLAPMLEGRFAGTMCLTEPHAGSDVGATRTRARHLEGDVYAITGTKCFISSGDHDLTENIVHLVLARIDGAPPGTKGLSLFIVPKVWVEEGGALGGANDVATASIEHKLGIRASATATLTFGDDGRCRGILVGGRPHEGMRQMFRMMNGARIAVGVQGIAVASTAYLNALAD